MVKGENLKIVSLSNGIFRFRYLKKFLQLCIYIRHCLKMAIILPTGQWYAPSAVINDAWYCMVLHGIALYCIVLLSIAPSAVINDA